MPEAAKLKNLKTADSSNKSKDASNEDEGLLSLLNTKSNELDC